MRALFGITCCLIAASASWGRAEATAEGRDWTVPAEVRTTWTGNSFDGAGASSQVGRWVQNMISDIEVSPEGTAITASSWDENGRCTGLFPQMSGGPRL